MSSEAGNNARTPGLQFFWWETVPGEEAGVWWGQLAGSAHRLRVVADQLQRLPSQRNLNSKLTELAYHLENYFVRIYELRERIVGFVAAATNDPASARLLKSQKRREEGITNLRGRVPALVVPLEYLLGLLDHDITIRNCHTHEQLLNLLLDTGQDVFEPEDVLLQFSGTELDKKLRIFLRKEIRRLADVYADKVRQITDAAWDFLQEGNNYVEFPPRRAKE